MRVSAIGVSLVVGLMAAAQMAAPVAAHPQHEPRAELAESRIELPMDTSTRHPIVEVTIDDQGPFRFVVDSGAGGTLIDDDLAKKLTLKSIGKAMAGDASGNAAKEMPLVMVERIGIGSARFFDSIAIIGDLDAVLQDQQDGADGVLGFNTFADCLVTFDYPNGKLILEKGSLPPADGRHILEFVDDHHIPSVTLNITGVEVAVTLDTGAAIAGTLAAELEGKVRTIRPPRPTGKTRRMNSAVDQREARIDGSVMLGRHEIQQPVFSFMGERSVLGYHVFKHFAITFDQKAKTVRFARSGTAPITIEPRYTAGFGAKPTPDGRVVWYALDGLPAAQAGLKEGDLIVAANGKPTADYDLSQWRTMFEKPGMVVLDVRRDGVTQQIKIEMSLAVQ